MISRVFAARAGQERHRNVCEWTDRHNDSGLCPAAAVFLGEIGPDHLASPHVAWVRRTNTMRCVSRTISQATRRSAEPPYYRPTPPRHRAFAAPADEPAAGSTRLGHSLASGAPGLAELPSAQKSPQRCRMGCPSGLAGQLRIPSLDNGCPIGLVKEQLGHASLETTRQPVYVHAGLRMACSSTCYDGPCWGTTPTFTRMTSSSPGSDSASP